MSSEPVRQAPIYTAPYLDSDEESHPAKLTCPHCGSEEVYMVDRAVRWNPYSPDATEPNVLWFSTSGQADFEGDGFICGACGEELTDPEGLGEEITVEYT